VLFDLVELLWLAAKSRSALVAENLFLRKQLAMFQERNVRPHRAEDSARWLMAYLSRLFDWRGALVVVKPDTLIGIAEGSACSGAGSPSRWEDPPCPRTSRS
jgi:putative transposase